MSILVNILFYSTIFDCYLKTISINRTTNGYLTGFNAPYDPRIRNIEVVNSGFYDIRRHQGARRVRLQQLMKKN